MTRDIRGLQAVLAAVEWRGLLEGIEAEVDRCPTAAGYRLKLALRTRDVRTGFPTVVHRVEIIPRDDVAAWDDPREQFLRCVHRLARHLLLHEVDEGLWVDGAQFIDPHPDECACGGRAVVWPEGPRAKGLCAPCAKPVPGIEAAPRERAIIAAVEARAR